jgi:phytoene dehydrogenase-like protein
LYKTSFPGFDLEAPLGRNEFFEAYGASFPEERQNLSKLMDTIQRMCAEMMKFPSEPTLLDFAKAIRKSPTLARYSGATLQDVMDWHIKGPKLKSAFSSLWPYLGLPPSRLSFLYWSAMLSG